MEIKIINGLIVEASAIPLKSAPMDVQKAISKIIKVLSDKKLKVETVFDGIHGFITMFDIGQNSAGATPRYDSKELKNLMKIKEIRWIDFGLKSISVGL